MIVAIDGPSGVGKSTVARRLARRLGIPYLETGAMYRALGLEVLRQGVDPDDQKAVAEVFAGLDMSLEPSGDGRLEVLLNGEPLGDRIRETDVSEASSQVSAHPEVRRKMVTLQRSLAQETGAVLEGRDIGTKVFPETPFKFFLEAPMEVRVERRFNQLRESGQTSISIEEVRDEVGRRDFRDTTRADSPLTLDATYEQVETGDVNVDEVVEEIVRRIGEISKYH
ncbi:MAG: (d)CMP kinase [Thermoanaerobaculia bacterium]